MEAKEIAFRYFKKLRSKRNTTEFMTYINAINGANDNGLSEEEVESLVDSLIHAQYLPSTKFQSLLGCIVPHKKVSRKAALNILQWIFTNLSTGSLSSLLSALEWITGLIDFGLTDTEAVHAFYDQFYLLLKYERLVVPACKLIHLMTDPSDVTRCRVKKILSLEKKYGKKLHATSVLCLFKSYKPECVPEKLYSTNLRSAFKKNGKMSPLFQEAQTRLQESNERELNGKIKWTVDMGMKRTRTKFNLELIPSIDYVHFKSQRYRERNLYSLLEFKTMKTLCSNYLRLDIPCNTLSLLQNDAGIHVLTFGSKDLHSRFSFNLYYDLYRAFIDQEKGISYEDKEHLLKQIIEFEENMQQGIPVVSRFLAEYLMTWDGEDFQEMIFHMLQWITFDSFSELHDCILIHIRTLFVTSDVEVKCSIIAMLSKLIQNIISVDLFRGQKEIQGVFLQLNNEYNSTEVLKKVTAFISRLCVYGIAVEQENIFLLHEVLNYFEMITNLEVLDEIPIWTMMPPAVVYSGLFSRNAVFLERVCKMLMKYDTTVYPKLRLLGLRNKFITHISQQQQYIPDFINCLYNGNCFTQSTEGYIFNKMHKSPFKTLQQYVKPDEALTLENHFAMLPYIAMMEKDFTEGIDRNELMIVMSVYCEEIANFINFKVDV